MKHCLIRTWPSGSRHPCPPIAARFALKEAHRASIIPGRAALSGVRCVLDSRCLWRAVPWPPQLVSLPFSNCSCC